jgi:hypothetical protein
MPSLNDIRSKSSSSPSVFRLLFPSVKSYLSICSVIARYSLLTRKSLKIPAELPKSSAYDKMSGFDLPTKAQLMESCNAVESVLDSLRNHTSTSLTNRSRIISPVKALFTSLQRLEEDEAKLDGAFHTTDARARHNLAGVLTSCGVVAGQLRKRINSNALRHDDGLGIELMTLTAEIEEFMKLGKKKATARPKPGTTSESSALVEDLLRKQQKHESEVEGLGMKMFLTKSGTVMLTWRQRLSYILSTPAKGPSSKRLLHSGLSSPPRTS